MAKMEFGELDQYLFGQATHYDISVSYTHLTLPTNSLV